MTTSVKTLPIRPRPSYLDIGHGQGEEKLDVTLWAWINGQVLYKQCEGHTLGHSSWVLPCNRQRSWAQGRICHTTKRVSGYAYGPRPEQTLDRIYDQLERKFPGYDFIKTA